MINITDNVDFLNFLNVCALFVNTDVSQKYPVLYCVKLVQELYFCTKLGKSSLSINFIQIKNTP